MPSEASALSSASVEIHDVTYELATQNNGSFVRNFSPEEIGSTASGSVRFRFTNNESGEQSLNLLANPFGYVYTLNDQDREVRVHDAVVSIEYRTSATDSWKTWNANTYSQTNPQITNQQGEYGFVVPTGKYRLKAEADGYHQSVSDELITNGEPINLAIELKPLGVVGSALDTIGVMNPIDTAVNAVDQPRTNAINVIIAALTILATLGLTIAPVLGGGFVPSLIMTGNAPTPLTNILLGIAQRMRRNRRYGRVYDAATNKPIQGATIRLFSEGACGLEKGKLIGSQTTNEQGFYHIYAAKGKYRIEAIAPNYTFPSKIAPLGYKGEVRTLIGSGPLHPDIPLDGRTPAYANVLLGLRRLAGRLRRARLFLLIGGSIFSIIAFMLSRTQLNGIVLGIYVLIWLNEAWIYLSNKRRARVRSGSTPICLALVRIYDEDGVLLATRATDERGEFNVLLPIGVYTVTIVKNGYEQLTKAIRQRAHGTLKTTFKLKKISA